MCGRAMLRPAGMSFRAMAMTSPMCAAPLMRLWPIRARRWSPAPPRSVTARPTRRGRRASTVRRWARRKSPPRASSSAGRPSLSLFLRILPPSGAASVHRALRRVLSGKAVWRTMVRKRNLSAGWLASCPLTSRSIAISTR